jgi:hypothetical protein
MVMSRPRKSPAVGERFVDDDDISFEYNGELLFRVVWRENPERRSGAKRGLLLDGTAATTTRYVHLSVDAKINGVKRLDCISFLTS